MNKLKYSELGKLKVGDVVFVKTFGGYCDYQIEKITTTDQSYLFYTTRVDTDIKFTYYCTEIIYNGLDNLYLND